MKLGTFVFPTAGDRATMAASSITRSTRRSARKMRAGIAHGGPPRGYIFGTPVTVAEQLRVFDKAGLGGLILRFDIGPHAEAMSRTSLELLAREVAPRLRVAAAA